MAVGGVFAIALAGVMLRPVERRGATIPCRVQFYDARGAQLAAPDLVAPSASYRQVRPTDGPAPVQLRDDLYRQEIEVPGIPVRAELDC